MDNQLTAKGWYLSEEGLKACQVAVGKENPTANDIIKVALNCDLRHLARKYLPENINTGQADSLNGPVVLQIQKVRNVSAPLANQDSKGAPRMLKLNLTDGCNHCVAIEFDNISFLNMNLIPGSKVCLIGSEIQVVKGCILLDNHNIKLLGGEVETLKTKWEASKQVATSKRYGKANDDPPPAFTEFDSSKPTKGSRNAQRRNTSQDYKNRDDKNKDSGSKQTYTKKTPLVHVDQKATEINQEKNQKSETLQKKDNYELKKTTDKNQNSTGKGEYQGGDYGKNNVKNEYKSLWNGKKVNQSANSYKDEDKKVKIDTYKDKKANDKDTKNWDRDSKSASSSASSSNYRDRDKEKTDSQYKNDSRGGDKRDYQREPRQEQGKTKSYEVDREKKTSQDYRMREKKLSNEHWSNDEYDRKVERKKGEKDLWSDEKPKEQRDSKYYNKKGKSTGEYTHDDHGNKSNDTRNSYRNDKQVNSNDKEFYRDGRNTNKELYSDRRDQRASFKLKNERDDKFDYGDSKKTDTHISKTGQDGRNNRNYNNDKGRRDREMQPHKFERDEYDTKYDKSVKGQSKEFREKNQWKGETREKYQYDGDKSEVRNDGKKPVAYDARSQNWFYDGEMKDKKDDSQCNDLVSVSFKEEGKHGKKDASYNRVPFRDSDGYHSESKQSVKKNNKNDYYNNDYRGDGRYAYNKKEQKNRNSKPNDKNFPDRDNNEDRKEYCQGKQNYKRIYNKGDYSKDNDYDNYNSYRDKDRSDFNREAFQSRRQQSDDSHSSKSYKDNTASTQRPKYIDKSSKGDEHFKSIEESNAKYSPGKRIPLEILFGKTPCEIEEKAMAKSNTVDNIAQAVSNVVTPDQINTYQPNTQYPKISTKELMERSLEQGLEQSRYNHVSPQDILFMQFSAVNQLNQQINQQIPYPYPQTIQPVPNIQVPSTSQYIGYSNEHAGGSAAAAAAVNPYLSYPNPRNNFQYNQMHTQHRPLQQQLPQQQQTQNLGNDVPFYSNNAYYYQVNNPQITQVPEQYQ